MGELLCTDLRVVATAAFVLAVLVALTTWRWRAGRVVTDPPGGPGGKERPVEGAGRSTTDVTAELPVVRGGVHYACQLWWLEGQSRGACVPCRQTLAAWYHWGAR
jgi:hypothetical protein